MTITYNDLRDRIGDKLGYGVSRSNWSSDSTRAERVERVLEDGLRDFFNPPALPNEMEQHQWSFLSPVVQFPLAAGVYRYVLPANFSMLQGSPTFVPGDDTVFPPLEVTGAELLRYRLQQDDSSSRPRACAVQLASADEAGGTRYELLVFPVPDAAYVLDLPYRINPTLPGEDLSVPLGGQPHEQTLIESCLAAAEMFDEFASGVHQQKYMMRLKASVSHDRQAVSPFNLGVNGDNSDRNYGFNESQWRASLGGLGVTYGGVFPDG